MPTAADILEFEAQFDAALTQMIAPQLQAYQIPLVTYHSTQSALVPRLQARFVPGTQDIDRGAIFTAPGSRNTAVAWGGQIIVDLVTRRTVPGEDPRPTLGLIRSLFLPKNGTLNNTALTYLKVIALDEVASNRGTWQEGQEKADISSITYQIIFGVQDQYASVLAS